MAQVNTNTGATWGRDKRGVLTLVADTAANDSDKTLTVPTGCMWEVLWISASLATTATVGNRNMRLLVGDGTSTIATIDPDSTQAASATEYFLWAGVGAAVETPAGFHYIPLPTSVLPAGYTLRIYDSAAVDAAADDLSIYALVIQSN
jgi:hypothetical protein